MCILSPKLVEVGRHPNIELLTLSELEEISGEEGAFDVKVIKHARYVDEDICTGCGVCANTCPVRYEHQIPEKVSYDDLLSEDEKNNADAILQKYENEEGILIQVLQDVNAQFNYLPENVLKYLSQKMAIPLAQIYHVATFYSAFSLEPRGEHIIKVCAGTACHVRGTSSVIDEIGRVLKIKPGETTEDMQYTLETVNCLGACALGPVMVLDGEYIGNMSSSKVKKHLKVDSSGGENE
jgi:NADH-quinone oxidoreductase subunit E